MTTQAPASRVQQLQTALQLPPFQLRFSPQLEQEFRAHWAGSTADASAIAIASAALLMGSFLLVDAWLIGPMLPQAVNWVVGGGVVPALLAMAALAWVPRCRPWMGAVTGLALVVSGAAFVWAFVLTRGGPDVTPYAYEAGIVFCAYTYLFSMLLFWPALCIGSAYVVAYLIVQHQTGAALEPLIYSAFFLGGMNLVGIAGRYMMERQERRAFIGHALVQQMATHDALTSLLNRRGFDAELDLLWKQAYREDQHLTMALVDVDHFKRLNDDHGHQAGDAVLAAVGEALTALSRRPLDRVARYGGDEFCGVWYGTVQRKNLPTLIHEAVCSRLAALAEREGFQAPTVSVGMATIQPRGGAELKELFARADSALYQAKLQGRDRVSLFNAPGEVTLDPEMAE